eukprot:1140406-Pelagomonas_calceolata.AAC.10
MLKTKKVAQDFRNASHFVCFREDGAEHGKGVCRIVEKSGYLSTGRHAKRRNKMRTGAHDACQAQELMRLRPVLTLCCPPASTLTCSEDWDDASDRLTKLAYQDVRHAQAVKEALREHHYAQFTFAPEINPRSRAIGKVSLPGAIGLDTKALLNSAHHVPTRLAHQA